MRSEQFFRKNRDSNQRSTDNRTDGTANGSNRYPEPNIAENSVEYRAEYGAICGHPKPFRDDAGTIRCFQYTGTIAYCCYLTNC